MDSHEKHELTMELIKEIRDDVKEIKCDVKKQNGRVRNLEIKWGVLTGAGAVLVFLIPILIRVLFH